MARQETMVQLTDELRRALDEEADRRGVSRSALVREAVTAYLAGNKEAAITRAIVEGYQRVPQGTPDEWGAIDEQLDASARETLQRLESEEREQGLEPW